MSINGVTLDELSADAVEFIPGANLYRSSSNNVETALNEIRQFKLYKPTLTATTTSGLLTLTNTSNTLQVITGSATGYSAKLPDATTLNIGSSFQIVNRSSESLVIQDGNGSNLLTLISGDTAECILESASNIAGTWITIITSATASGLLSYSIGSDTTFTTSSTSFVVITGQTITPVSGRYQCIYSADITIGSNNRKSQAAFYKDGTLVTRSQRTAQGTGSNYNTSHNLLAEISVNGSEAIDVRVNINSGSVSINQRRMILIRLGS